LELITQQAAAVFIVNPYGSASHPASRVASDWAAAVAVTWTLGVRSAQASDRTTHLLTEWWDRFGAVVRRTRRPL
jgi:hypothetical protein